MRLEENSFKKGIDNKVSGIKLGIFLDILRNEVTSIDNVKGIAVSKEISELRMLAKSLLLYAQAHFKQEKEKAEPSESLAGTYEEMYSNWRNKVEEAVGQNNVLVSFVNMCNLQYMFAEIADETAIGTFNIMEKYNPDCLEENVRLFDVCLQKYEEVYKKAGIEVKRFENVEEFVTEYLKI